MDTLQIKKSAREILRKNFVESFIIEFCYQIIIVLIRKLGNYNTKIMLLTSLLELIILAPMSLGLMYSYIKIKNNEKVSTCDFIKYGFTNFSKSWKIYLNILLKMIKPILFFIKK